MQGGIGLANTAEWTVYKGTTRVVVATPGTAVQILNSEYTGLLLIQALTANEGNVAIGDSSVDITDGSENYIAELEPGQTLTLPVREAQNLYLDADTADDGIVISEFIG